MAIVTAIDNEENSRNHPHHDVATITVILIIIMLLFLVTWNTIMQSRLFSANVVGAAIRSHSYGGTTGDIACRVAFEWRVWG